MINDRLISELRYKSESTDLDFKSEQYRFSGAGEYEKSEILKDILAIANSWRDGTGYILLGLKDNRPNPAEIVGISESIDDSRLQEFVNSKVTPKLTFRYEEHVYEEKKIGIIIIPKQKRPFYISNNYGKLKSNIVYVRRGSSTGEANPIEVGQMAMEDSARGKIHINLSALTSDYKPIPETIELEFLKFPKKLPDFESKVERSGTLGYFPTPNMWHDNKSFWREYAEFIRVQSALIEINFTIKNTSETLISNAKLEIRFEPMNEQSLEIIKGKDLPTEPEMKWSSMFGRSHYADITQINSAMEIDESSTTPTCQIQFGALLPSEEKRSPDTLAIIPSLPGKFKIHLRILAAELSFPQESEITIEAIGEETSPTIDELENIYGRSLLERYQAESK